MKSSFELGDTVTIRDWIDMVEEFSTHNNGRDISMPFLFTEEMDRFCNKKAMIMDIDYSRIHGTEKYSLSFNGSSKVNFYFGIEMFKENAPISKLQEKLRQRGEFDEALI